MSLIEIFDCGDVVENRYQLDIKLHEGRWGDIYRGTDRLNDKPVAIRFFPITEDGPDDYERFQSHARELSGLTAPGVVTPIDHGITDEIPYLVYHWAGGQHLKDRLAGRGKLDLETTVDILEKLLEGLARAHESRMTHGLIRPVKVVIDNLDSGDPLLKIVDFQIWRFYEWSRGTKAFEESNLSRRIVRYTSPEVLEDHRVKPSTDVYATGLLAIELLTGQPAFDDNNRVALIARQMSDETAELGDRIDAGDTLRKFIAELVAKDEGQRFRTASQALSALRERKNAILSEPASPEESAPADDHSTPATAPSDESSDSDEAASTPEPDDIPARPDASAGGNISSDDDASSGRDDNGDIDPDSELFEGDPSAMQSLSDGESLGGDSSFSEDDFDDGDDLFADEGDFGTFYDDEGTVSSAGTDASAPPEDTTKPRSPDRNASSSSGQHERSDTGADVNPDADGDDLDDFDASIAEDIPKARGEERIIADTNAGEPDRGPGPGSREPASRRSAPRRRDDDSDISLPVAAAILLAMLAVIAGATYVLVFSNDDPMHSIDDNVEAHEQEVEPESFDLRIATDPPGQNILVVGNDDGISPMTVEVYEQDFPLEVRARKDAQNEKQRVVDEPTNELLIEFED